MSKDVIIQEANSDGKKNDPISFYERTWLLVAPILSGNGTRTKFFEAMATKLPIVTTRFGMEGINIINKKQGYIVEFDDISKTVVSLLNKQTEREKIGLEAKKLVSQNYTWEMSAQKLNNLYSSISKNA